MSYEQQRRDFLIDKYKIKGGRLSLESDPQPRNEGKPLDEVVKDFQIEQNKNSKLKVATASTSFKTSDGKALTRLWFDVKIWRSVIRQAGKAMQ